jgi:hypothetical protein
VLRFFVLANRIVELLLSLSQPRRFHFVANPYGDQFVLLPLKLTNRLPRVVAFCDKRPEPSCDVFQLRKCLVLLIPQPLRLQQCQEVLTDDPERPLELSIS